VEELMGEPQSVVSLIAPDAASGGIPLLAVVVAAGLLALGQSLLWLGRASFRFGFDPQRSLVRWGRIARTLGAFVLVLLLARWGLGVLAPAVAAVLLLCVLFVLAVTGTLQDIAGGLHGQLRLRLREGDRVRVGRFEGELRSVHWERISLRQADGASIYLQNRVLLREPVEVYALRGAIPLCVTLAVDGAEPVDVEQLRNTAAVMPYRLPGTLLEVSPADGAVQVRCYVWSEDAARAATRLLQAPSRARAESDD
jgi:hypothetical protein